MARTEEREKRLLMNERGMMNTVQQAGGKKNTVENAAKKREQDRGRDE